MYACKVLADSISEQGHRLVTYEVTFPRMVLAEMNTHKSLSKNSASSRAIPVAKAIKDVEEDPFIPETFHQNQSGMQAEIGLSEDQAVLAQHLWQGAMDAALDYAGGLERIEVHKGLANRIIEPFKYHTAIISGTDWSNFFALRTTAGAQPEIRKIALMMQEQHESGTPQHIAPGAWHLPLVTEEEIHEGYPVYDSGHPDNWIQWWNYWKKVSIGRCARVSYLTHHGVRDPEADIALHDRLLTNGHLSPFEHVARPFSEDEWGLISNIQELIVLRSDADSFSDQLERRVEYEGNLRGWHSARQDVPHEDNYQEVLDAQA